MAVHNHRNRCSCYHSKSNVVVDKSGSLPRKPRRSCNSPSLRPRAVLIAPQRMTSLLPEAYQPRLRVKSYQASLEHITRGKFTLSTNRFKSFEIDCLSLFLSLSFFYYLEESQKLAPFYFFFFLLLSQIFLFSFFLLSIVLSYMPAIYVGRPRKRRVHREAFDRPPAFRREDPVFLGPSRVASLLSPPTLSSSSSSSSSFTPRSR